MSGWTTEGWWNLSARTCETLLRGDLVARFYYIYAIDYDRGGEWSGQAFMCTRDKEFTIRGNEDCLARGFDRAGFFEVDTGEQRVLDRAADRIDRAAGYAAAHACAPLAPGPRAVDHPPTSVPQPTAPFRCGPTR